jgi:hypothetical protein
MNNGLLKNLKFDFLSGLIVFFSGVISCIVGDIEIAIFSNSALSF